MNASGSEHRTGKVTVKRVGGSNTTFFKVTIFLVQTRGKVRRVGRKEERGRKGEEWICTTRG